jgi:hypothetical protein
LRANLCDILGRIVAGQRRDGTHSMRHQMTRGSWILAASLLHAAALTPMAVRAQGAAPLPGPSADYQVKAAHYALARRAFEEQAAAYWKSITEKRRGRIAKRRSNEPIGLDDYVLTQPPVYTGPPRPIDPSAPRPDPSEPRRPEIPVLADFLRAALEQFRFVPEPPESEIAFKRAYAKVAAAAGITKEQAVRVYAFETGGNGTYDVQAGLTHPRPGARAISPAMGYNQLLSTNSIGLLAEHGDQFLKAMRQKAEQLGGDQRRGLQQKIEVLRRMIAFTRSVPNSWAQHDILAKSTPGGLGIHAAILDRDIGPLLQTQKLVNSVRHARRNGYHAPLTAGELELMNLTGDGNGFDMVTMPPALRQQVPTANFFQQSGYERNPIARRTGTVAALLASIDAKMDQASQLPGAKELAAAFQSVPQN